MIICLIFTEDLKDSPKEVNGKIEIHGMETMKETFRQITTINVSLRKSCILNKAWQII